MLVVLKGLGFHLQKLQISSKQFMGCWKAVIGIIFVEMKGKLLGSCLRGFCMTRRLWSKICQACGARLRATGLSRVSQGLSHSEGKWLSRGAERFWRELCTDRGLPCLLPQSVSLLFLLFSLSAGDVVQSHRAHPLSCISPFLQLHKSTPTPC